MKETKEIGEAEEAEEAEEANETKQEKRRKGRARRRAEVVENEETGGEELDNKKSVSNITETMPVLLNASKPSSKSRNFPVKLSSFNTTMTNVDSLPKPKLPGVPKANNIEGSAKVLKANKHLIEAAQTGDLRKKLSRASWGITPVLDRKDELL